MEDQKVKLESLRKLVIKYKEEVGQLPDSLSNLKEKDWFPASDEALEDPLGGEFILDKETGNVEARNPKY